MRITHVNLNDDTVEGLAHETRPIFSVQYHPEASPGPHDAGYFFGRFREMVARHVAGERVSGAQIAGGEASAVPRRDDIETILVIGAGPDRDRPGLRVRLLGLAGLQGAARGGLPGRAGELEPGHDHDRPRVRRTAPTSSR